MTIYYIMTIHEMTDFMMLVDEVYVIVHIQASPLSWWYIVSRVRSVYDESLSSRQAVTHTSLS